MVFMISVSYIVYVKFNFGITLPTATMNIHFRKNTHSCYHPPLVFIRMMDGRKYQNNHMLMS